MTIRATMLALAMGAAAMFAAGATGAQAKPVHPMGAKVFLVSGPVQTSASVYTLPPIYNVGHACAARNACRM